jgi:hypothetical protein
MLAPPFPEPSQDELLASSPVAVRELASGIDALYLSGRADLSDRLFQDLARLRARAEVMDEPQPLSVAGEEFLVAPRSHGKYRYKLRHRFGIVGITDSTNLPAIRVEPLAEQLHAVGPEATFAFWLEIGDYLAGGPVWWSVSRLDLFCDVQGWQVTGDDRHRFVCRAKRRDLHEEGHAFTGFEFGRRSSNTICARIYDKTLDIEHKGSDWWYEVWGDRFDRDRQVLRVEFELGRKGLTSFGIDTPAHAFDRSPGVWAGLTADWLSYRAPTNDDTRARWPEALEWEAVQGASLAHGAVGLARIAAAKRKGNLRVITAGLVGYLASVGAILGLPDADATLAAARRIVTDDVIRRGIPFESRIADRAAALGAL